MRHDKKRTMPSTAHFRGEVTLGHEIWWRIPLDCDDVEVRVCCDGCLIARRPNRFFRVGPDFDERYSSEGWARFAIRAAGFYTVTFADDVGSDVEFEVCDAEA